MTVRMAQAKMDEVYPARSVGSCVSPVDEEALVAEIHRAWTECRAATEANDKAKIRALHLHAKAINKTANFAELCEEQRRLKRFFPTPTRIDPERIRPRVVPVHRNTLEERLFKVTRGYWSMPYSKGYGRRLRFLIFDDAHEAVVGIIALQSPSADLACRDRHLGVAADQKLEIVNNTLDAYTIGAAPAYAPLLAGKLVAGYLCSPVIRQEYWRTYANKPTTQLKRRSSSPLLAITTASAFGRSSIYNRLRDETRPLARSLGYTRGFGTIHLEEVYPQMVQWLTQVGRLVPAGFGNGPKVRWQNITNALIGLGIPSSYLEHGLKREVFIIELVTNLLDVCRHNAIPDPIVFDDEVWANHWRERWALPRAARRPDWHEFDATAQLRHALHVASSV
jgi:hypothetical protein